MAFTIRITSEEEAWAWFQRALEDDPTLDQPLDLSFDGWPVLDLRFAGPDFQSSVPTRIMPPLLEAQREIHRLFAQLRYGQQNLKKLTLDDRDRLELNVIVGGGSSQYKTNLAEVLTEISKAAIAKMESKHILITVLGIALTWGSTIAWKAWLDNQAKQQEVESRVRMSELETDRLALFARAHERQPAVADLAQGVDEFRNESLGKLKPADSFTLPGSDEKIDGRYAADLVEKRREQSREARIDGEFVIQSVASGETSGYRVKVKRVHDGQIVHVTIPDGTLTEEQAQILQEREWAKRPLLMQINAKMLRGQITSATLVSATIAPGD